MGIVLRQSIKGTLSNYLGVALGAFTMLILFPKLFEPDQIGLVRVLQDIGILVATLSQVGIVNIIDRFFPYFHEDKTSNNGFVLLIILYPLIGFLLIFGVLILFKDVWITIYSDKSPLLVHYFIVVIPLAFFMLYQQVLEAYTRAVMRITVPIFVREVFLRLALIIFTLLYAFDWISFDAFIYSLILSYSLTVLILIFYLRYLKKMWIERFVYSKHKVLFREMVKYGAIIFLTGFVAVLSARIDVVMLSAVSLEMTGVYSIAFFMGTVIEMPKRAISQISIPLISNAWKSNDLSSLQQIYNRTSIVQTLVGGLFLTLLLVNIKDIFNIMPNSDAYIAGIAVVFIIGISRFVDMATGLNAEVIISSPFYKINFFLTIFLGISNIVFNSLLIPRYGMEGAAVGTLISYSLSNFIRILVIRNRTGMIPFTKASWGALLLSVVLLVSVSLLNINGQSLLESAFIILIKSIVITAIFLFCTYRFKFSEDFNHLINRYIKPQKNY